LKNSGYIFWLITISLVLFTGCVTKKKRKETSKVGKFYHNTTAYYNGYWNAKELIKANMILLRGANVDNFSEILEVEDFITVANPKMVDADMNKAIEKVTVVSNLHEPSEWVDDCYVLMAKAQYLKQDYETAEATLQYFQEDFNPKNPYGRNYTKKPLSKKALNKARKAERKEKEKEKEKAKKEKEKEKVVKALTKEQERKAKAKEREKEKKQRDKERAQAKKNRAKGIPTPKKEEKPVQSNTESKIANPVNTKKVEEVEETPIVEDKKKDPPKDNTAYNEGLIWLVKTFIKRQKYYTADLILKKLESIPNLSSEVLEEIPATYANLYIKQKNYSDAIPKLEEAIKTSSDRELRARYSFIIAQIYERQNESAKALEYYSKAKKTSKNFKMEFMANMAVLKSELVSGQKTKAQTLGALEKMISEEKYADVKDQIYFTMAEIELTEDNIDGAIVYFQLSIKNNKSDDKLRVDAYYTIADEMYKREKYREAKLYYDSTEMVMNKTDHRFENVKKLAKNLTEIAKKLDIVSHQDSLLYFASLSGDEQKNAMKKYLESRKSTQPEKGKEINLFANKKITSDPNSTERFDPSELLNPTLNFGNSTFFAYNIASKEKSKAEFIKVWGSNLTLQDNWRVSSKTKNIFEENKDVDIKSIKDEKLVAENEDVDFKNLIKELPQSPVQKKEAQEKIINALFELGKLYRSVLENYQKSASTLENMHSRFGPTQHELDSYYYLFLDYTDLNNREKATFYKNKIVDKYPESAYAKILSDPNFVDQAKKDANKVSDYYDSTYEDFKLRKYAIVKERIKIAKEQFGEENKYAGKFALLDAMTTGNLEGKEAYIKAMNNVVIAFPNTPEQLKAREIIRFLTGDAEAFTNVSDEEAAKLYSYDETRTHFLAVVTYGLSEKENIDVKISISEYNKTNFKLEKLQMSDATLNKTDNSQIILIKKFADAKKAMEYYEKVQKSKAEFITMENVGYDIFPISQANYLKMLGQYSATAYRIFFNKFYLEKK